MKGRSFQAGTSLVEMMISVGISVIVIGALLMSAISIQKAIHGSEVFAESYSAQRRITDYLARDLRRSRFVESVDATGATTPAAGDTITIEDGTMLRLTLPGYYESETPGDPNFNQPLSVIETDRRLDYGTVDAGFAPPAQVTFRKDYEVHEGCVCFVRQEAGVDEIVVRKAENLSAQVSVAADGRTGTVKAWFPAPYSGGGPLVSTYDEVMLRNLPEDFRP